MKKMEIYLDKGKPNFPVVLSIPRDARLPSLHLADPVTTITAVSTAISLYMTPCGITDECAFLIAELIISQSFEDQLSLQDVMIFCKQAAAGAYGAFMRNTPTVLDFMAMFEEYRQERHEAMMAIRDEQSVNHKALGPSERESDNADAEFREIQKTVMINELKKNAEK